MAAEFEIWHNQRCSKSRQTLALLEADGTREITVRRYLEDPPDVATLKAALQALGLEPWEIARTRDKSAAEVDLPGVGQERERWIEILAATPALIERPIVLADDGRAALGRPPENVLELVGR